MTLFRAAIRECRTYPLLSAAIGVTLALVLASSGLAWAAFECLVLRAVPGPVPSRVVTVGFTRSGSEIRSGTSASDIPLIRDRSTLLEEVGGYRRVVATATLNAGALEVSLVHVTPGFFESFGTAPAAGHWPTAQGEDSCALVISDGVWRAAFDRDNTIVGRTLDLRGTTCAVAAVAPPAFNFPDYQNQVWMFRLAPEARSPGVVSDYVVFGLMRAGTSPTSVAHELNSLLAGGGFSRRSDSVFFADSVRDRLVGPVERTMVLMVSAVIVLVLAACTNIVSLLMARDWSRQRDVGLKLAMGATRRHLFRDALLYLLVVATGGTTVGLLISWWSLEAVRQLRPRSIPALQYIALTPGLFGVVLLVALGLAIVASSLSTQRAWHASGFDFSREGRSGTRPNAKGGAGVLVAVQVALSVVLAVSGGLFSRSLVSVLKIDPGFDSQNLEYFHFSRDRSGTIDSDASGLKQLLESVRSVRGVSVAALTTWPPFIGITEMTTLQVEADGAWDKVQIPIQSVSADYFTVMKIPIVEGRVFDERMRSTDPCEVVISETMSRKVWRGTPVLGRRLDLYNRDGMPVPGVAESSRYCDVVGVVADVRERVLTEPTAPRLYFYLAQRAAGSAALMVRVARDTDLDRDSIKALVRAHIPQNAQGEIRAGQVADRMRSTVDVPIFQAWLFGLFAGASLVVLSIGVFGISWFTIVLRMKEIGIRLSLGAQHHQVVLLLVWQGARPVLGGVAVGTVAAAYLSQYLGNLLIETAALDGVVFVWAPFIIATVGIVAVTVPVLRARRVDPKQLLQAPD